MDLKDIKAIIDLMKKNSISEFELERQDFKVRLKRGNLGGPVVYEDAAAMPQMVAAPAPAAALAVPASSQPTPASTDAEIKSPMIGTLYRSPSPEAAPYVDVGSEVGPDTVVCIIEAMKLFNEIECEVSGTVVKILADDMKPVEYGQPLFLVDPA